VITVTCEACTTIFSRPWRRTALRLHLAQRVERGVIAADARIELQRDAHRLPDFAESRRQLGEPETILRARERSCRSRRIRFRTRRRSGEAALSEQRAVKPALRERPACMRFTIAPYCAAISPAAWVPAMPSAWTVLSASSLSRAPAPAPRKSRASPPNATLPDMLLPHAQSTRGPTS